jgi:hypothetical protein
MLTVTVPADDGRIPPAAMRRALLGFLVVPAIAAAACGGSRAPNETRNDRHGPAPGAGHLTNASRGALAAITPRVVDVHVEAVLVGAVADAPEACAELAALWAAQVADRHARRLRIRSTVFACDTQDQSHQPVGATPGWASASAGRPE